MQGTPDTPPGDDDEEPLGAIGWHDSTWELRRGLDVIESFSIDAWRTGPADAIVAA